MVGEMLGGTLQGGSVKMFANIAGDLVHQSLDPVRFTDAAVCEAAYPEKDYSVAYVAEIEAAYEQK